MKTILFQGDSITDAGRTRDSDRYIGSGYPMLVSSELGYERPDDFFYINRGIGGNKVTDLYLRVRPDIIHLKPDYMSILVGINDVWAEYKRADGVDAEKYYRVYSMLLEEVMTALPETRIMLLEPFVLPGTDTTEHWEEFSAQVRLRAEKVRLLAEKFGLVFVPLQDKFDEAMRRAPSGHWLVDGVHPTPAGHQVIKRQWMRGFEVLSEKP